MATPEETLERFHIQVRWAVNQVQELFPYADSAEVGQEALILLMSYADHMDRPSNGHGKLAGMEALVGGHDARVKSLLSRQLRIDLAKYIGRTQEKDPDMDSLDHMTYYGAEPVDDYWEDRQIERIDASA